MTKKYKIKNIFTIISAVVLLFSALAVAHEAEEPTGDYFVELTPETALQNDDVALEVHITDINGSALTGMTVAFTIDRHEIGLSETIPTKEREPGHYYAKYNFQNAGGHEIHVEFSANGEMIRRTVFINVVGAAPEIISYLPIIAILAVAAIFAFNFFLSEKKKGKGEAKKKLIRSVIWSAVILAAIGIGYSLYVYFQSGAAAQGIIVCSKDNPNLCVWQAHIHSYIVPMLCGVEERLPTEVGSLQKSHTHEEKNTLHWHDRLPYDKSVGDITDKTPLTLDDSFHEIGVQLTDACFMGKCDDDLCGSKPGTLKIFANTEKYWEKGTRWQEVDVNYVWSDRDIIYIAFDEKSNEETLSYLNSARIEWPILGVG